MMRKLSAAAVALSAVLGILLAGVTTASATTAIRMTESELAAKSDVVVVAEVEEQRSFRASDGLIYTDSQLKISDVLTGEVESGETVRIRQMGGTVGDETLVIPGDAELEVGERAVFFLADREPEGDVLFLTQLAQSKYEIVGATEDGDLILMQDLSGLAFYDPNRAQPVEIQKTVETHTLSALRAVVAEVK